jgi:hypothetical protein
LLNNKSKNIYYRAASICLVALFVFSCIHNSCSQGIVNRFFKLSCPEKRWVISHLFIANGTYRISKEATEKVIEIASDSTLDGDSNGGQLDAFRHAYWMARITQTYGWRRARSIGKSHEKGNYRDYKKHRLEDGSLPDESSGQMDFLNNDVGIQIGKDNLTVSPLQLTEIIKEQILAGKLFILRKDEQGHYLKCNGELISSEEIKGNWTTPKCIIESNKQY